MKLAIMTYPISEANKLTTAAMAALAGITSLSLTPKASSQTHAPTPATAPATAPATPAPTTPTPTTTQTQLSPAPNKFVAQVIFAEAGGSGKQGIVSPQEMHYVASVIKNRLGNKAYSSPRTMEQAVRQSKQFSCIGDKTNTLWSKSEKLINMTHEQILKDEGPQIAASWNRALAYSTGDFTPYPDITQYHDTSIKTPKSWTTNKYWVYKKEDIPSKNFIFFSVTPRRSK